MIFASRYQRLAGKAAHAVGHPLAFILASFVVVGWAVSGPIFRFSDTWQLVINTGTNILTLLMVFLIQNTQNIDGEATQLKLDELIRALEGAHNALLDLESLSEKDLARIRAHYTKLAERARRDLRKGLTDTGTPDVKPE